MLLDRCTVTDLEKGKTIHIPTSPDAPGSALQNQDRTDISPDNMSGLAYPTLLFNTPENASSISRETTGGSGSAPVPNNWTETPNLETPQINSISSEGNRPSVPANFNHIIDNLSESAQQCMQSALAKGTQRNYSNRLIKWRKWCIDNNVLDPNKAGIANVINYLNSVKSRNISYGVVNLTRSAISATHELVDGQRVGSHPLVSKFMRGVSKEKPPKARYSETWDITKVLEVLGSGKYNPDDTIGFKKLKHKVVALIMLSTACRQSVIPRLQNSDESLVDRGDHFILHPSGWDKNPNFVRNVHDLMIFQNNENLSISPYHSLQCYLGRLENKSPALFHSDVIGKPLLPTEVAKWITKFMREAGVPLEFKAHSLRGATVSKANVKIAALDIMEAVDWKKESTFRKFYLKNVQGKSKLENRRGFQDSILS